MAEKVIVTVICMMAVLCLFVFFCDILGVISKNMEFNDVCRTYMHLCEQNSGMDTDTSQKLEDDLLSRGFTDVQVNPLDPVKYGEIIKLEISAVYSSSIMTGMYSRELSSYEMKFSQRVVARKIHSNGP